MDRYIYKLHRNRSKLNGTEFILQLLRFPNIRILTRRILNFFAVRWLGFVSFEQLEICIFAVFLYRFLYKVFSRSVTEKIYGPIPHTSILIHSACFIILEFVQILIPSHNSQLRIHILQLQTIQYNTSSTICGKPLNLFIIAFVQILATSRILFVYLVYLFYI